MRNNSNNFDNISCSIENVCKKAQELSWDNIAKVHMKIYEKTLQSGVN